MRDKCANMIKYDHPPLEGSVHASERTNQEDV